MSDDRRGALEAILREMLTPLTQRLEDLAQENQALKEQIKQMEDRQKQIIQLLEAK